MKRIYESYQDISDAFTNGDSWTHQLSDHEYEDCIVRQNAIEEFSIWLDKSGLKISVDEDTLFKH